MTGLKKITILAFIVLSTGGFAVAGCGSTPDDGSTANHTGTPATYTIADATGDWGYPSPYAHYLRGPGYIRMSFLFDTLVWEDAAGLVPALADAWEFVPGDNAYVFHLNKEAPWHDGTGFSVEDVRFTFEYIEEHPYQWVNSDIVSRTEVLGDREIKIYLQEPYAPFLETVVGTMPILPKHIWENVSDPLQFQEAGAVVGTGPFKLVNYNQSHGTYMFEGNSDYYGGEPVVDTIRFVKINSQMGGAALEQEEVNVVQVPPELADSLAAKGFSILSDSHDYVAKLVMNHTQYPFSEIQFRQALAYAIDRGQLVATYLRGHGLPGSQGLLPPDNPWYNEDTPSYPHDPEKAQQLLAEVGFETKGAYLEKNGTVLEVELLLSEEENRMFGAPGERTAEIIKSQLEQVGIKVNLRSFEAKTLDSALANWNFELALNGHGGLGGDPEMINTVTLEDGFNSVRFHNNPELNDLLREQLREMVPEQRSAMIDRIQEIYAGELPCICLYYPTMYYAHDGSIDLFFTYQGIALGVPIPFNKTAFVGRGAS